ncbi:MFS family permease [Virgibacillus halotolerans]|uniref:MFS transporter n=1 Tax=Virgibacillus halotolerans TaxID=1071053 RepID=UPI0019620ED9|nr:MFS transporter [Virgibacillus halotolerans]MBM7601063.1 MFS family permease [Virgibacillus halotolerans]
MTKQTYILTFLIFILSTGGYTAMPLFPLLTDIHSISLAQASTLTAIYIFTQQTTPVFLGPLGDYYGYKKISIIGEMIRGIGFIGVGSVSNYISLLLFASLAGLGGGFAGPSLQSLMMKSAKLEARAKVSSLRASATNAGLLLGPVIAGIVIWTGYFNLIFISAGILYLLGAILLFLFVDPHESKSRNKKLNRKDIIEILHNKGFIQLMIFMLMYYIIFAQLFVTMPEYAKQFTNQIQALFLINGITGLILQYPVGLLISKYNKPIFFVTIGITLITLSFLTLSLWNHLAALFLAILLFTIGGVFILPIIETAIARYSDNSGKMGLYFGVSKLSDGLGRPLGSLLGGWLFYNFFPSMIWFTFAIFSVFILIYVLMISKIKGLNNN